MLSAPVGNTEGRKREERETKRGKKIHLLSLSTPLGLCARREYRLLSNQSSSDQS
ncbi:unnamed protein product [Nyctereutes procyonoides]|uniref:(raccoon dog) hypothetical protein n=1 Tax=Nyctereutes procyonoides TaxID=34880 RepID=A0A811ZDT7_NYCPR|nr:unnamed protein product [Nyctereutes procyonoides]